MFRGDNYPREILFSCAGDRDEDFKDDDLFNRFFREYSVFVHDGTAFCRVCTDQRKLQNKVCIHYFYLYPMSKF